MGTKKSTQRKFSFLKKLKNNKYIILLSIISSIFLASVVRYGLRSFAYPVWDEQHYIYIASAYYRLLHNLSANTLSEMLKIAPFRQPGYPLFILPFLMIFGLAKSYFWGIFVNGLFHVVSTIGIYFVAKHYFSRLSSFLASFIFAFYGWALYYVHLTYSETSTSTFCVLAILFLIKSDYFQKRKQTLLFGLFMGLGILMKWEAFVFLFGPLIYTFYKIFNNKTFNKKSILINTVLTFLIVAVLAFPYFANFYWVFDYFKAGRFGGKMWEVIPEFERNPFTLYSLTYYINSFQQLGIFYFILFLTGFLLAFKKTSKLKIILSAIIVPWIFFSFLSILKADRLIIPIYPYIAIISASVFDYIKLNKFKIVLITFTIAFSICTFLGTVWGKGPLKKDRYFVPIKLPFGKSINIYLTSISRPPDIYRHSGPEIIDFIVMDSKKNNIKNPQVIALFYYRPLDEPMMAYNLYAKEKPLEITNFLGTMITDPDKQAEYFIDSFIKNANYVLVKSGQKADSYFPKQNYETLQAFIELYSAIDVNAYYQQKAKFWVFQDSSEVIVLKKKNTIEDKDLGNFKLKLIGIFKNK
jgi:hypothetical protein